MMVEERDILSPAPPPQKKLHSLSYNAFMRKSFTESIVYGIIYQSPKEKDLGRIGSVWLFN